MAYRIWAILTAVFILLSYYLIRDDSLDPKAIEIIRTAEETFENDAYYYLLGIAASSHKSPVDVGKIIFANISEAINAQNMVDDELVYDDSPLTNPIELPVGNLFCHQSLKCTFDLFYFSDAEIKTAIEKHKIIMKRFQTFISFNSYKTLAKPVFYEPVPPARHIAAGNRLIVLSAIYEARLKHPAAAISILEKNVANLRKMLVSTDHLLIKMITVSLIAENIDALSLLANLSTKPIRPIALLSAEERSLEKSFARDFLMTKNMFEELGNSGSFAKLGIFRNLIYKNNMLINQQLILYSALIEKETLSINEFAEDFTIPEPSLSLAWRVRNIVGYEMINATQSHFPDYIARMHDLNAKLALYNALMTGDINFSNSDDAIPNPYYPTSRASFYDQEFGKGIVCFDGPIADKNRYRCLLNRKLHRQVITLNAMPNEVLNKVDQGDLDAQITLGLNYITQRNPEIGLGIHWLEQAAQTGYGPALDALSVVYILGEDDSLMKDPAKSEYWVRQAMKGSNANNIERYDGVIFLGEHYRRSGEHVKSNEIFKLAAKKHHRLAQYQLGWAYEDGLGIEKNEAEALRWYQMSANNGGARAQIAIGMLYLNGKAGFDINDKKAVEWVSKAADQDHELALDLMGLFYKDGIGVEKDYASSIEFFSRAIKKGAKQSCEAVKQLKNMGVGYETEIQTALHLCHDSH